MPATTKNLKIPYPTGGDPVRDGPQTFAEAMQLIDDWLHEPFIIIDGQRYPLTGAITPPTDWSYPSVISGHYNATLYVDMPYLPPEGWTFQTYALKAAGYSQVSTSGIDRNSRKITCRLYNAGSGNAKGLSLIGWRLVSESTDPNRLQGNH